MNFDVDFFARAQSVIHGVVMDHREELLSLYGNVSVEIKDDNSPVTALDKKIERALSDALTDFESSIGVLGEEYGASGNTETFWLIDPIDGTESFIRGLPSVRNMVTLIADGEPRYVYVYKPVTNELFTAIKGQGAYKNGQRLKASQRPIERCWIDLSAPLGQQTVWPVIATVRERINGYRIVDFTTVAEGAVDGHFVYQSGGGDWDYAPRGLLLAEAGYKVTNIGSDSYDYRNHDFLAAAPAVYDQLMPAINQALQGVTNE